MERAAGVLVAYASVEVPMYRFPPMLEMSQCLLFVAAPVSERSIDGRVPAISRSQLGVVVPTPRFWFEARKSEEVAVIALGPLKYGNCPVVPE